VTPAIEKRELITMNVGGICLRGTYHRSDDEGPSSQAGLGTRNRIGVVFFNHGYGPRASAGCSAVYWAGSFAHCGYPSFRFDLPGLGDSDGDVPAQMREFVDSGGYAPILSATVKELVERFKLSGVVILGYCAGAVTALYTAVASKECRGLVLMDPYFFLPRERTKFREELSRWASWSRLGALIENIHSCLRHIRLLVLRRNRPPRNANWALLRCWNQLASLGMPMLVMKAPVLKARGIKPPMGQFDYLGYLQTLSGRGSRIAIKVIKGTNHSFADGVGRAAIRQHTEQWLNACFQTTGGADDPDLESCPVPLRSGRGGDRGNEGPQVLHLSTSFITRKGGLTL
jgi:pimeloyl-ACP methyl ester carboxylesterase